MAKRRDVDFELWTVRCPSEPLTDCSPLLAESSIESIVATEPKDVIRYFSMMSQNLEAENLGLTTVEAPA